MHEKSFGWSRNAEKIKNQILSWLNQCEYLFAAQEMVSIEKVFKKPKGRERQKRL